MKSYKTAIYNQNGTTHLIHHKTAIVKHNHLEKTIELDSGGWQSKTTKDRMNAYFNENNLEQFGVFQKDYAWWVLTPNNNHKNPIPYRDGIVLKVGE